MALQIDQRHDKKDSISYYKLLKDERTVNIGMLMSGK